MTARFLLLALWLSAVAMANRVSQGHDPSHPELKSGRRPAAPTVPTPSCSRCWQIDPQGKATAFDPETPGLDPKLFYARYDSDQGKHVWVTGDDFRPLLPHSRAKGERLGYKGEAAAEWFQLEPDGSWIKTFEQTALVRRLARDGTAIITEDASRPSAEAGLPAKIPGTPL